MAEEADNSLPLCQAIKLPTLDTTHKPHLQAVNQALQSSNFFPSTSVLNNFSSDACVNAYKKQTSSRITNLINKILSKSPANNKIINPKNVSKVNTNTVDSFVENVSESNNDFKNYITLSLDNCRSCQFGRIYEKAENQEKIFQAGIESHEKAQKISQNQLGQGPIGQSPISIKNKYSTKPQENFEDSVDNSFAEFLPKIKNKPNSIIPLPAPLLKIYNSSPAPTYPDRAAKEILEKIEKQHLKIQLSEELYSHPYKTEVSYFNSQNFVHENEKWWREAGTVDNTDQNQISFTPDENFKFIETENEFNDFLSEIESSNTKALAIDIEYHSQRSFQGFICLIQISSPSYDYIIDAIKLRKFLPKLNKILTDPKIEKIFHGGDNDNLWLQQVGCYLVNVFDTQIAQMVLSDVDVKLSYKKLCQEYLDLSLDKGYQTSDWRRRPLLPMQLKYAREDTRRLRQLSLILKSSMTTSQLIETFERCKQRSLIKYEKPKILPNSWMSLIEKMGLRLNQAQEEAVRLLYAWRDGMARKEDESKDHTLPNFMLLNLARELPKEQAGILACCSPMPQLVRENLSDILEIIEKARLLLSKVKSDKISQNIILANSRDTSASSKVTVSQLAADRFKFKYENEIDCPHDLRRDVSRNSIDRRNLPKIESKKCDLFPEESSQEEHSDPVLESPSAFIQNINHRIESIHPEFSKILKKFEWDFIKIDKDSFNKPATIPENIPQPKLEATEIDMDRISVKQSKKFRRLAKKEAFADMAAGAPEDRYGAVIDVEAMADDEYKSKFTGVIGDFDEGAGDSLPVQVALVSDEEIEKESEQPKRSKKRKSEENLPKNSAKKQKIQNLKKQREALAQEENGDEIDIDANVEKIRFESKVTETENRNDKKGGRGGRGGKRGRGGRNRQKNRGGKSSSSRV